MPNNPTCLYKARCTLACCSPGKSTQSHRRSRHSPWMRNTVERKSNRGSSFTEGSRFRTIVHRKRLGSKCLPYSQYRQWSRRLSSVHPLSDTAPRGLCRANTYRSFRHSIGLRNPDHRPTLGRCWSNTSRWRRNRSTSTHPHYSGPRQRM